MTQPEALPADVLPLFVPLHKRAFGMAIGAACGLLIFGVTVVHLVRRPEEAIKLGLLGEYFYGYTVSWGGAFIGMAWAFIAGFVAGWFTAFVRNFVLAASLWFGRDRGPLDTASDFLDNI